MHIISVTFTLDSVCVCVMTMISSNTTDGSKPYIVEDRPMISRSSGDRGEMSRCLQRNQSIFTTPVKQTLSRHVSCSKWSQNYTHTWTRQGRDWMFYLFLFPSWLSDISQMSLLWLSRVRRQWNQGFTIVSFLLLDDTATTRYIAVKSLPQHHVSDSYTPPETHATTFKMVLRGIRQIIDKGQKEEDNL